MEDNYKIAYVVSDLKRVGPTNQTYNIIENSKYKEKSLVITLFEEPKDSLRHKYEKSNIEIICLNLNRRFYFLKAKKLEKILKKINPIIVHSYGVKADCLCNKVSKNNKWDHIITLRNYPKEDILTRMNYIIGKIALHFHLKALLDCKNVICCSETIKSKMEKDYPFKKFYCIQNGVDLDRYRKVDLKTKNLLRKENNIEQNCALFICTNSFIERKRIDETIEVFKNIPEKSKKLLFLGDGILFDKIKKINIDNSDILFYGKSDKVAELLGMADYFISTSESEGLPNSVLEAIACGIPVILSNIPQHKEILDELDVGYMYDLGKPNTIKSKYVSINTEQYSRMKNRTLEIRKSNFTMKNMSEKYIETYEKIGDKNEWKKLIR